MVFGVFDGFHEGHQHFLREALARCQKLVVVVAHPQIVATLKQRTPLKSLRERLAAIQAFDPRVEATIGDTEIGTWSALKHFRPDVVLLGYDQERLGDELAKLGISCVSLSSHYPEKFKSSLLNQRSSETED